MTAPDFPSFPSNNLVSIQPEVNGLRFNPGITAVWTEAEQLRLEQLLEEHADKPEIARYALIVRDLGEDKSIRDVALRVKWMQDEEN